MEGIFPEGQRKKGPEGPTVNRDGRASGLYVHGLAQPLCGCAAGRGPGRFRYRLDQLGGGVFHHVQSLTKQPGSCAGGGRAVAYIHPVSPPPLASSDGVPVPRQGSVPPPRSLTVRPVTGFTKSGETRRGPDYWPRPWATGTVPIRSVPQMRGMFWSGRAGSQRMSSRQPSMAPAAARLVPSPMTASTRATG